METKRATDSRNVGKHCNTEKLIEDTSGGREGGREGGKDVGQLTPLLAWCDMGFVFLLESKTAAGNAEKCDKNAKVRCRFFVMFGSVFLFKNN